MYPKRKRNPPKELDLYKEGGHKMHSQVCKEGRKRKKNKEEYKARKGEGGSR